MDDETNLSPFPFFKLPAEIRNIIYRLVIVTEQTLCIRDMHLRDFKKHRAAGTCRSRSTYWATDHVCNYNHCPEHWKEAAFGPIHTTYTLDKLDTACRIDTMTLTMLSLDRQSREEVAFLFYSGNTFHFTTINSLVPFLKDRTLETRKYIHRVQLILTVIKHNWDAVFLEHGRPAAWNTAFSSLLKLPSLNVKELCIRIDDTSANILVDGLNLRSRSMLWLHKLSRFGNLEMLGVEYAFEIWKRGEKQRNHLGVRCGVLEEVNSKTEEELWRFLAPKMLKDPHAIQQGRICMKPPKSHQTKEFYDLTI